MSRCIVYLPKDTGLCETELEGTKLAGKKLDDFGGFWRGYQNMIYSMNNAVGSELYVLIKYEVEGLLGSSHNINGNDPTVEVYCQSCDTDVGAQPLKFGAQALLHIRRWNCLRDQNSTSRIEF